MATGYSTGRAAPHELFVSEIVNKLNDRGYEARKLPVKGYRPDIRLGSDLPVEYVDVKTGLPNLAIEIESWNEYQRIESIERGHVYIVWRDQERTLWVFTVASLMKGIDGGPRRPTGRGSNTDWYKINPKDRGVTFDYFFPAL